MPDIAEIQSVFNQALDLPEGTRRTAWLIARCQGEPELFAEVDSLLAALAHSRGFRAVSLTSAPDAPGPLPRFGPYRCTAILGTGGMGTVYRAQRDDGQFVQQVAIKVLRGSLRAEWIRERFLAERQILARLNHPGIAKLLDGGMTAEQEPYVVMELVEGTTIDSYCDTRRLTVAERLRLFDQVLDAVAYAHRNLVVHRDLKPSNILVTDDGSPKLVDFGTAKLIGDDDTVTALRALTPRYASPEQLRGEPAGVASDVFSAAVVLFELCVGAYPFGQPGSLLGGMERARGNAEPSSLVSLASEDAASARSSSLAGLRRELNADLEGVLRKSLAGGEQQRYQTVAELREDLLRYREGRPVTARPGSALHRAAKFVRRNRWRVAAVALAAASLAGVAIFSVSQMRVAQKQAQRAERINRFMNETLGAADPSWYNPVKKGAGITLLDVLGEMDDRMSREFRDDPDVEADLRTTIARTYSTLGMQRDAQRQLEIALRRSSEAHNRNDPRVAAVETDLAKNMYRSGQTVEAYQHATGAVRILYKAKTLEDKRLLAEAYNALAVSAFSAGRPLKEAEDAAARALELSRELNGNGGSTPTAISVLEATVMYEGKFDQAEALAREALQLFNKSGGFERAGVLRDLAFICLNTGDYACAQDRSREAIDIWTKAIGSNNLYVTNTEIILAAAEGLSGQAAKALSLLDTLAHTLSGPASLAGIQSARGAIYLVLHDYGKAEPELRQAYAFYSEHGKDRPQTYNLESRLGQSLLGLGRTGEAAPLLEESYRAQLAACGPRHPWTLAAKERFDELKTAQR